MTIAVGAVTLTKVSEFEDGIKMMRWESGCERREKGETDHSGGSLEMMASERVWDVSVRKILEFEKERM